MLLFLATFPLGLFGESRDPELAKLAGMIAGTVVACHVSIGIALACHLAASLPLIEEQ